MDFGERAKSFCVNYDLLINYNVGNGYNKYIGEKDKFCRFCGKNKTQVTFRNKAHAIPEFLGNKQLILHNECDPCNEYFSNNLEVHLDKFTRPFRLSSLIKGKSKIPAYKSKDKLTRINLKKDGVGQIISPRNSEHVYFDEETKTSKIRYEIEPYIPVCVYKCLVKIGLSVMAEEDVANFKHTIQWIMDKEHHRLLMKPLILRETYVPGPRPFREVGVKLFKEKSLGATIPAYILVISFGNISYQLIMPSDIDISKKFNYRIVDFPLRFEIQWKYGYVERQSYDLSSPELVKGKEKQMYYSYGSLIELPALAGKSFKELGIKYGGKK